MKELEDALNVEHTSVMEILKSGSRPVFIIFFLMFFQTSSGCDTVSIYSLLIFSDFEISQHTFSLLFQGMITLGYLVSPFIMMKMNRKPQLVISSLTMSLGLVLVGSRALLPVQFRTAAPLIGVVIAGLSYGTGVGSVPFALMSEIFPQRMKRTGLALALSAKSFLTFCHIKAFPSLRLFAGMNNIFYLHSLVLLVSVVFVPETRDRSVKQLELIYKKDQKENSDHRQ